MIKASLIFTLHLALVRWHLDTHSAASAPVPHEASLIFAFMHYQLHLLTPVPGTAP